MAEETKKISETPKPKAKAKALWRLTEGQRGRYLLAAVAMSVGIVILYLSPLIVRATIDGIIAGKPVDDWQRKFVGNIQSVSGQSVARALAIASVCVIVVTFMAGAFTYLKGHLAALA